MEFQFKRLTREFLAAHVNEFVRLIMSNMPDEYWTDQHFLTDLPGKWDHSFYVSDPSDQIAGFIIASEKPDSLHVHKFVVDKPFQNKGLGSRMIDRIIEGSGKPVSLKLKIANESGLRFYSRKGFVVTGKQQDLYTMNFQRTKHHG